MATFGKIISGYCESWTKVSSSVAKHLEQRFEFLHEKEIQHLTHFGFLDFFVFFGGGFVFTTCEFSNSGDGLMLRGRFDIMAT